MNTQTTPTDTANKINIATLMQESGAGFGTSGARGRVNDMTDQVCYAYTTAFLQHLESVGSPSDEHTQQTATIGIAGILCAHYLGITHIATPVSSNTAVEKSGLFKTVSRTRIGSSYVIAAMQQMNIPETDTCG